MDELFLCKASLRYSSPILCGQDSPEHKATWTNSPHLVLTGGASRVIEIAILHVRAGGENPVSKT
jgi:hypothetical protein